jgi:hypothetical protein
MTADNSNSNLYDGSTSVESSQEEMPEELIHILEKFETDSDEDFEGF